MLGNGQQNDIVCIILGLHPLAVYTHNNNASSILSYMSCIQCKGLTMMSVCFQFAYTTCTLEQVLLLVSCILIGQ